MSDPIAARRAAALEIARTAGLLNRLEHWRSDLRLALARLRDLRRDLPRSNALGYAISDLEGVVSHLDHLISAVKAEARS